MAPVDRDIISIRNSCAPAFRQRPVHRTFVVLSSRHNKPHRPPSAPGTGNSEALIIAPPDICFPKLHTERGGRGRRKEKRGGVKAPQEREQGPELFILMEKQIGLSRSQTRSR